MTHAHSARLVALARRRGVLRAADRNGYGIPRADLTRLVAGGVLGRSSRGVYVLAGAEVTESHGLAEASRRVPHGVVCLLSALQFHGLTTQAPVEVWLAVDRKARLPKEDYPPLRVAGRHAGGGHPGPVRRGSARRAGERSAPGLPLRPACGRLERVRNRAATPPPKRVEPAVGGGCGAGRPAVHSPP